MEVKCLIIGGGNMGRCLEKLLKNNCSDVVVTTRNTAYLNTGYADYIFLTVKPKDIDDILDVGLNGEVIISFLAGRSVDVIEKKYDEKVIRCMSNINMQPLICYKNKNINNDDIKKFEKLLEGSEIIWIDDEKDMDTFTCLIGSGPAFLSMIYKYFVDTGVEMGLDKKLSKKCIISMLIGMGKMFEEEKDEEILGKIVERVASKGGVTEEGLKEMDKGLIEKEIKNILMKAKDVCSKN